MSRNGQSRLGTRAQPEQTRAAILDAALREFAQESLAGARTDAIARAAGVNKALISYYFGGKEGLYRAALDRVFRELSRRLCQVLDEDLPPKEKILAYAGGHFDFIAQTPMLPRLVHRELMQTGRGATEHVQHITREYLQPVVVRLSATLEEGMRDGVFRRVDPPQFAISMVGVVIHYFTSGNIVRAMMQADPFSPERLAARRAAVLDFISAALFTKVSSGEGPRRSTILKGKGRP